jgi:phosphoribosylaminoimidazole-succinocarboxamide synthase
MLPIEFVVRGYLSGSGWKDYTDSGGICGHALPAGLVESQPLPSPIVTPATKSSNHSDSSSKAAEGHDLNISEDEAAELCGEGLYAAARDAALALYRFASAHAAERGIVLADTKFELGVDAEGTVTLGDEVLTPDSSRFWPLHGYAPGGPQPSFDKQFVRDWCLQTGWDRTHPGPALPEHVVAGTRARYVEAFERLTEIEFARYLADPKVVL